jgi:hypothetical protein
MKPLQIVADTTVVIAGMRSKSGVSNAFLRHLQFVEQYGIKLVTPWQVLEIVRNMTT